VPRAGIKPSERRPAALPLSERARRPELSAPPPLPLPPSSPYPPPAAAIRSAPRLSLAPSAEVVFRLVDPSRRSAASSTPPAQSTGRLARCLSGAQPPPVLVVLDPSLSSAGRAAIAVSIAGTDRSCRRAVAPSAGPPSRSSPPSIAGAHHLVDAIALPRRRPHPRAVSNAFLRASDLVAALHQVAVVPPESRRCWRNVVPRRRRSAHRVTEPRGATPSPRVRAGAGRQETSSAPSEHRQPPSYTLPEPTHPPRRPSPSSSTPAASISSIPGEVSPSTRQRRPAHVIPCRSASPHRARHHRAAASLHRSAVFPAPERAVSGRRRSCST
jgi:hypothetical protein